MQAKARKLIISIVETKTVLKKNISQFKLKCPVPHIGRVLCHVFLQRICSVITDTL